MYSEDDLLRPAPQDATVSFHPGFVFFIIANAIICVVQCA